MAFVDRLRNGSKELLHSDHLNKNHHENASADGEAKAPGEQKQNGHTKHTMSNGHLQTKGPEGGFDSTPIPSPPPGTVGYTLKITFHQATSLAMGDAHAFSSDPYVLAQLNTDLPMRHKEDPPLRFRTQTVRKNTDPEWNEEWIVANVPSTGFELKARVYDEDPADRDDLLGKVHFTVPHIDDDWRGVKLQAYKLAVRDSSKRALIVRTLANALRFVEHMTGNLYFSIESLGRTGDDGQNGRMYTLGPCRWIRHYSPLLGRLTGTREPDADNKSEADTSNCPVQKRVEHYNFQANQMQLQGPVPPELYHRFVEFKPWVRRMFSKKGFQGVVLGKALHHQHKRVYNFGRDTLWGYFEQGACAEMTKQFLDLVHYDKGGRIFTYVLTLDALFRFTETGKEFGIDMLSKHTMHSDVSIYIAFSGEFFIRRLKHPRRPPPPHPAEGNSQQRDHEHQDNETHPPHELGSGPPADDLPTDPSYYELFIDNDSGTYRPNAAMLPVLAEYLSKCLPGLHVQTLDCQADAKKMAKLKSQQREVKKREGDQIVYAQVSDSSSLSSSDDEALDEVQAAYHDDQPKEQHGPTKARKSKGRETLTTVAKDVKMEHDARMEKMMSGFGRNSRDVSEFQGPKTLAGKQDTGSEPSS